MPTNEDNGPDLRSFSIFGILHKEIIQIKRKGLQSLIGLGLTVFFFYGIPRLVYPWYCILQSYDLIILIVIGIPISVLIPMMIINLIMNNVYSSKYSSCEKYRIMKKPWPWEVDEKGYSKQYKEIIINTVIGNALILPILLYSLTYFNLVEFIVDPTLYPSSLNLRGNGL